MEANLNELMEIDKTEDKHFLPKIIELHREGVDLKTLESIFFQRYAIESWLRDTNMDDKDPIELRKDNTKGVFRQNQYKLDGVKELWISSVIYEDNDVTINRPESFQVSQAIGYPIWCYSYNQNSWDEHYIGNQEAIYMVHNVMEDGDMEYTTVMVSPNGKMLVLDANHKTIKGNELKTYLKSIGDAANYLLPQTTDNNKTNINCSKNMNKKNTIRLTESDLKRVISESVKKILNESTPLHSFKVRKEDRHVGDAVFAIEEAMTQISYLWDRDYHDNAAAHEVIENAKALLSNAYTEIEKLHDMVVEHY